MPEQSVKFAAEGDRPRDLAAELRSGARVLREQWWLVLLATVVGALGAYGYTKAQDVEYQSTARLLLLQTDPNAGVLDDSVVFTDPARERATDIDLIQQQPVARRVAERLDAEGLSAGEVLGMISTNVEGDSNVLSITATSTDPAVTGPVANAFASEFIDFERATQRRRYRKALKLVQARIRRGTGDEAEAVRLREQAQDLRLLSSLQTGDAQFIEGGATPGFPVGTGLARNTVLGALLGLLVGLLTAFLRDRLDPRLKTEDEIAEMLPGIPVIATIPRFRSSDTGRRAVAERYHLLQADLEAIRGPGDEAPFLLVTSAMPGEGKSSTAANLALAIRERGRPVILVEADGRNPELSRLSGDAGPGLTAVLAERVRLEDAIKTADLRPGGRGGGPSLAIEGQIPFIPAGEMSGNHHGLLNGPGLERFLTELAKRESLVVIDGPPLGLFSDMSRLSRLVDQVIVVVRLGQIRRRALRGLVEQLSRAGTVPAGIVITGAAVPVSQYGKYAS